MGILSGFRNAAFILLQCAGFAFALIPNATAANNAKFSVGPDSNYLLLLDTLKNAKSQIFINIYEFNQAPLAALMIDKIREGIDFRAIIETQPCCNNKMTEDAKKIVRSLHAEIAKPGANPNSRIFLMGANVNPLPVIVQPENPPAPEATPSPAPVAKRRYRYNHAKYAVIDGVQVMISSENLTESGHPLPGTVGNRGYTAAFLDASLVQKTLATFAEDTDTKNNDVLEVGPRDVLPLWMGEMADLLQNEPIHWEVLKRSEFEVQTKRKQKAILGAEGMASKIDYFFSPNSLAGLEEFVDRATTSLKVQFMSMPATWSAAGGRTIVNPILKHAIDAASKGVKVRFLLNDERTFDPKPPTKAKGNEITVAYLDKLAECYNLPISSKIIDVNATGITYIHNKGMIVDAKHVLVSSINGTANSVANNRETAVAVESEDMGDYYTKAHDYDWTKTTKAFSDERVLLARDLFQSCPAMPLASEDGSVDPIFRSTGFGILKFY